MRADIGEVSTTTLGDWFATALFWRLQVALLVNACTFIPAFMELAPNVLIGIAFEREFPEVVF
ncbi:MAG: hypothetical protein WD377_08870, partial [Nitriliruptoraceae bacterium]